MVWYLEQSSEFGLKFSVLFSLDVFTIQPNFITKKIVDRLDDFIVS